MDKNLLKSIGIWIAIGIIMMTIFNQFSSSSRLESKLVYSQFMDQVKSGNIEKVRIAFRARYERLKVLYRPLLDKPLDEDSETLIESIWNIEKHSFNWFTGEDNE